MKWLRRLLLGSVRAALPAAALVAKAVVAREINEEDWPQARKVAALEAAHRAIDLLIEELERHLDG
jgi:hypothetical protein